MKHLFVQFLSLLLVFTQSVAVADYRLTLPKSGLQGPAAGAPPESVPPESPSIFSISPTEGLVGGGETVVLLGENFQIGATVDFDGAEATVLEVTASSASVVTPAHAAGTATVTLTNPDNLSGSILYQYRNPAPSLTGVAPDVGLNTGGTSVTLTGSGFLPGATVAFGGVAATDVTVQSATQATAVTPAHAVGRVDVTLTNPDAQGATQIHGFYYGYAAPTISSTAPVTLHPDGGQTVTVSGANFRTGLTASIDGAPVSVTLVSANQFTFVAPAHAVGSVALTVTNDDDQVATRALSYDYPAPTLTAFNPPHSDVAGGAVITLTGANFRSGATVTFDGVAGSSASVINSTTLTVTTPAHASGTVNVRVTNPDGKFASQGGFLYDYQPIIGSLSTSKVPVEGGTAVTISGSNFLSGATVMFGGVAATSVTFNSATSLTAVTPAQAAGTVDVVVTNPNGLSATTAGGLTYANWTLAFTSRRSTDYEPGTAQDSLNNNPHASQGYAGVWEYIYLRGGALNQSNPWWESGGTKLVWDASWFGSGGQWARANDLSPNIYNTGLQHNLGSTTVNYMPAAVWRNPFNETIKVTVRGGLYLWWDGTAGASTSAIDLAIAKAPATGTKTLLFSQSVSKPNANTAAEGSNIGGINAQTTLAQGDSLRITLRTQTGSGNYYNTLIDNNLYVDVYRLQ